MLEGWFGIDERGQPGTGLSGRVRRFLGEGWEPADALLDWTLSVPLDDRTPSADLHDPLFREVWRSRTFPSATDHEASAALAVPGVGNAGGTGYVYVAGSGVVWARASEPALRWKTARVR